ncbi:peptide deformylase [Pseudoroseomonas globiformis]|uniref:Peptide deformylase n=1 Tax=Teichococcus globiformis TaxID=2307229 RepID=A0ABV7G150_9PROT
MAILKIARMGHPVLLQVAVAVPDPAAPEIRQLVQDMAETMLDAQGLGLAAPQIHVSKRIFVWRNGDSVAALINPEIELLGPPDQRGWEGCLSIPGLRGNVERAHRVAFRGTDIEGNLVEGEAEGLTARVMQHEFDHLNGVLYPSRMSDMGLFGFTDELARAAAAQHHVSSSREPAP